MTESPEDHKTVATDAFDTPELVVDEAELRAALDGEGPLFTCKPTVAIVGFAEGHRELAPAPSDTVEVWGLNSLHTVLPTQRWDRWFDLHNLERFVRERGAKPGQPGDLHLQWLRESRLSVWVRPQDLAYARSYGIDAYPYPYKTVMAAVGTNYFTNSVSWMIAAAILGGAKRLEIYGVDMAQDSMMQAEYAFQRPSVEFILGVAVGRGVEVHIAPGADLLRTAWLYGIDDGGPLFDKFGRRREDLTNRKVQATNELAAVDRRRSELVAAINQIDGAMNEQGYLIRNWLPPNEEPR